MSFVLNEWGVISGILQVSQYLTDLVMKDQVSFSFHSGLSFVDDDQVLSVVHVGQLGGGAHFQGGSSDDQAVGAADQVDGALVGFFRKEFSVEGDVWADHFAADGTGRYLFVAFKNKVLVVLPSAGDAVV